MGASAGIPRDPRLATPGAECLVVAAPSTSPILISGQERKCLNSLPASSTCASGARRLGSHPTGVHWPAVAGDTGLMLEICRMQGDRAARANILV